MRIRTIKPEFWKSHTLSMLPAETRLLAIALLNYSDDEGYFLAHPALIRGELFPFWESHASIPGMLRELQEAEYIRLGEDAQKRAIGHVVNFRKHQRVDKPQRSKIAGTVEFPDWSPSIPGIFPESSGKDRGSFLAGMEGNGRGMEEEGKGPGTPSPDKPGGTSLSAESSMPEATDAPSKPDAATSKILLSPKKKKGGGPPPEPEFPDDVGEPYRHALRQWWHYKRERTEGYKPTGWNALIRQQLKFPPEQVLASVEASMASNWAGLFTHKYADAVLPGAQKKGGGGAAASLIFDDAPPTGNEHGGPDGWRKLWPELYTGPCPDSWLDVPQFARTKIVEEIAKRRRGGK